MLRRRALTWLTLVLVGVAILWWSFRDDAPADGGEKTAPSHRADEVGRRARGTIPPVAGAPCRVTGTVRGGRAADVRVHVRQAAIDLSAELASDGRTFSADLPEQGELLIVATADDGRSAASRATCDGSGRLQVELTLPDDRTGTTVLGRCIYLDTGVPVAGALVEGRFDLASDARSTIAFSAIADEEGQFTAAPLPSSYRISCVKDGDAGERRDVRVSRRLPTDVEVYIEPKAALAGIVVDENGAPVAGLAVRARAARGVRPRPLARTLSDAEGRFVFRGLVPGPTDVQAQFENSFAASTGLARTALPYPEVELVLRTAHHRLEGRVVDPNGAPIEGASVGARSRDRRLGVRRSTASDAAGRFVITGLVPGPFIVHAQADGFGRVERVHNVGAGPDELELELAGACSPSVRIEPGEPPRPVVVTAIFDAPGPRRSFAGQTSRPLVLENVAGRAKLVAEVDGAGVETATSAVDLCASKTHVIALRSAEGTAQLNVDVVDQNGAAVADLVVYAFVPSSSSERLDALTDQNGAARFVRLSPGRYAISALTQAVAVTVAAGEERTVGLQVDRNRGDIAGTVEQDGTPVEGARILAKCGNPTWRPSLTRGADVVARTGLDGRFRFVPKQGGLCIVRAEHVQQGRSAPTILRAGAEPVTIALRAAGTLAGRVVAASADAVSPYTIGLGTDGFAAGLEHRSVYVDHPDGSFRIDDVPAGYVSLRVVSAAGEGYAQLTLRPGEARSGIEIPVFQEGRLSGRVVETKGAPVAGARVQVIADGRAFADAVTDPDGRFEAAFEAGSPIRVMVSADGYYPTGTRPKADALGTAVDVGEIQLEPRGEPDEKAGGIGIMFAPDASGIRVIRFTDDSPARDAGLAVGDVVTSIDGVPSGRMPIVNWMVRLRGPAGTPVVVDVKRGSQTRSYTVIRREIGLPEVPVHPN